MVTENKFMLACRHERFSQGIKIAHISDLHKRRFGRNNRKLIKKIVSENPDIIFVTGDIVSRTQKNFDEVENLFRRLAENSKVYFIFGNHEQDLPENLKEKLIEISSASGVRLLRNSIETVGINGRKINIAGVEPESTVYKKNGSYRNLDSFGINEIESLMGKCPEGKTFLLAHNPIFAYTYAEWGADYTFSGHIHGGAVRIFGRGIFSPERKFFPKYSKGVYRVNRMKLCVSAGLGKLRLFNPPEIVFYEV